VMKTLTPVAPKYYEICHNYNRIVIAEENLEGDLRRIMFGQESKAGITGVNKIGQMIEPGEILKALQNHE